MKNKRTYSNSVYTVLFPAVSWSVPEKASSGQKLKIIKPCQQNNCKVF